MKNGSVSRGFREWRINRASFQNQLEYTVNRADSELHGQLLNPEGNSKSVDVMSLFFGPRSRAYKYASEELKEWWQAPGNRRITFQEWDAWNS